LQPTARYTTLRKELGLRGVFAIATGTTLSAGFFLLPSLAAKQAGPAVVLAYALAGILLIPAMFSKVELATAMPRSGGGYYFLDRALGPLAGTIGGLGTWLALMLKTAFALVGMGAYVALFLPAGTPTWVYQAIAAGLAVLFTLLNLGGAKKSGGAQILLVYGLLAILGVFIVSGAGSIQTAHFEGFLDEGGDALGSTIGLVFISYVGVTKVASVAEEVRDPERNLPLGVFLSLSLATVIYVLGLSVMVGVVGVDRLASDPTRGGAPDLTPVATTAALIAGPYAKVGVVVVSIAALLAFSSVANAGIMSASRYPLAMSRDNLVPKVFQRVSPSGAPTWGVLLTAALVLVFIFVDLTKIAKLASAFQLTLFGFLCLSVIVMRESHIDSYDPGFRSPLYPWLQIIGIIAPVVLIAQMGWLPSIFTVGLFVVGTMWFRWFAADRVDRHGAIYHVFERLGRQRFAGLDTELRGILKEKGLRDDDPFDEIVALARVINSPPHESFASIAARASQTLAEGLEISAEELATGFTEGTQLGATPVTQGVALPHLRVAGLDLPRLVVVRAVEGVMVGGADAFGEPRDPELVFAVFFLVSPESNPSQHLRVLAQLAGRVEDDAFMDRWLGVLNAQELKEILYQEDNVVTIELSPDDATAALIGQAISDVDWPESCVVVMIRRDGEYVVPRGSTKLCRSDAMTVIGDPDGILEVRALFGPSSDGGDDDDRPARRDASRSFVAADQV
jgi:amino acid transporter/mannitol/fructose-specific phosphotransferase system IIA component (Ntr-type)